MGGEVIVHGEGYDPDTLSFFELEDICKDYGYKPGDLIYVREPDKTLMGGLHLISSDADVLFMVGCHKGQYIVHLYVVCFGEGQGDVQDYEGEDENEEEDRVDYNDPWWKDKLSDDEDLFDVDVDVGDTGTGATGAGTSEVGTVGDGDGGYDNEGAEEETGDEQDGNHDEARRTDASIRSESGRKKNKKFEEVDDDDTNSEMVRNDILESPANSDEEAEGTSTKRPEFQRMDLVNPELHLCIQTFREAVKEYNLLRGREIRFKKNERRKSIVVCRDDKCQYRVYVRQVSDEQTFQIRSMQPKHVCGRQYKNSIVNSTWISNKLIEKFRIQPNIPLNVIQHEVKEKWKVDVSPSMMYRARAKACQKIYGKLEDQYGHLWDYCETLRQTNRGSCVIMKVDGPNPNVLPKFGRLYFSLAAMKKGFLDGCRPVIGVDGCFLKGPFKGHQLAAVGRDGNNNMYPIAFAVVEAETKDSWT
ncbi:uncharacterized protein LOC132165226 [Corylus avellana]|uniref:uncharacterized protein LOC132165226 n=1 Tax=Corylus avellana TaxID=13451 RepID=UPI00286B9580|nr:uncharacterized protein LOC132165226 [Corylus avellana]